MCQHQPQCPAADRPDRDAARTIASPPEQGWSLLCNGVVLFDDLGELLPGGRSVRSPQSRPAPVRSRRAAASPQPEPALLAAAA